ncbi:elongation of very long chain fatty acids protein 5-like [Oppia nitens]|uniref:elongation of very long chain fatty acids protein 5-like n=1 Tax=Oppia nitens TaxID=1686743 RepID=UPI0023D9A215|nr:elongation of very long chain fatty acids protein 5-like [Oppia nitens]
MNITQIDKVVDNFLVSKFGEIVGTDSFIYYWGYEFWENGADPRSQDYFLVGISHIGFQAIIALYLATVFILIPEFMRKKRPYTLTKAMLFYNVFLVIINAYFCLRVLIFTTNFGREMWNFTNPKNDTSEKAMDFIDVAYWYYISKIVDFFDTFFMAFKKKNSQITVLHIWHHMSMVGAGWMYMKYNPYMPTCAIIPIVNGFIHVVMYGYYALASLGPKYQKYLWWKKYITQIQLFQFIIHVIWFSIVTIKQTDMPLGYLVANLGNAIALFSLFMNFYLKAYFKNKKLVKKD